MGAELHGLLRLVCVCCVCVRSLARMCVSGERAARDLCMPTDICGGTRPIVPHAGRVFLLALVANGVVLLLGRMVDPTWCASSSMWCVV